MGQGHDGSKGTGVSSENPSLLLDFPSLSHVSTPKKRWQLLGGKKDKSKSCRNSGDSNFPSALVYLKVHCSTTNLNQREQTRWEFPLHGGSQALEKLTTI